VGSAAVTFAQLAPRDYPQWRGRNRDGSASAFEAPKAWPDTLNRQWTVEVGDGYATPIVVGSTVYTFTRNGNDEVLTAFDAASGKQRWRSNYAAPYKPSEAASAHGAGPKATPLFHEQKLFTLGISGIVSAFDAATGTILWQKPEPAEAPYYGAASSPVGDAGVIVVHPGNYGPLTAFDSITGALRWTAGGEGFFSSPIVVTFGGVRQVVSATQQEVIGVRVSDGAVLWRFPWKAMGGATTPTVSGDSIIVSGLQMGVAAFRPARRDGQWVAEAVWQNKDLSMYLANPVVVRNTVFGLAEQKSGQYFALDAATGATLWVGSPREATNSAIVKSGDLLFLLNDDARLTVARASRTRFEPLKRYTVADSATWAQPAISGNRIFIKDVSKLTLWTVK